jgi:hypothetical protein
MVTFPSDISPELASVIKSYPAAAQTYALNIRNLIHDIASEDPKIGQITETLKWGEPAFLTSKPKSGTTLRFDWKESRPDKIGLFVHCNTALIQTFRDMFGSALEFEGNRAIWLDLKAPPPEDILTVCIGKILTYHLDKGSS